ncbi:MAG: hypothetical protein ABSF43_06485 [Rectinemataceae bacterium]
MKAVPVPLLADQKRIVAKIDELMALVDRLEAQVSGSRGLVERFMGTAVGELTK